MITQLTFCQPCALVCKTVWCPAGLHVACHPSAEEYRKSGLFSFLPWTPFEPLNVSLSRAGTGKGCVRGMGPFVTPPVSAFAVLSSASIFKDKTIETLLPAFVSRRSKWRGWVEITWGSLFFLLTVWCSDVDGFGTRKGILIRWGGEATLESSRSSPLSQTCQGKFSKVKKVYDKGKGWGGRGESSLVVLVKRDSCYV